MFYSKICLFVIKTDLFCILFKKIWPEIFLNRRHVYCISRVLISNRTTPLAHSHILYQREEIYKLTPDTNTSNTKHVRLLHLPSSFSLAYLFCFSISWRLSIFLWSIQWLHPYFEILSNEIDKGCLCGAPLIALLQKIFLRDRNLENKCVIEGASILLKNRMKFIFIIELCAHDFYLKIDSQNTVLSSLTLHRYSNIENINNLILKIQLT